MLSGLFLLMAGMPVWGMRLFHAPLPWEDYWLWLLLPLVAGISLVFKAIKVDDLRRVPGQAAYLFVQVIVFMGLAAGLLWVIVEIM